MADDAVLVPGHVGQPGRPHVAPPDGLDVARLARELHPNIDRALGLFELAEIAGDAAAEDVAEGQWATDDHPGRQARVPVRELDRAVEDRDRLLELAGAEECVRARRDR